MHILFTRFPLESAHGGAEAQTLRLMRGLRERGHEVAFVGSCPVLLSRMADCGLRTAELTIGPPPVTPWCAFSFLWRQLPMRRALIDALQHMQSTHPSTPKTAGSGQKSLTSDPWIIVMLSLTEKLLLTDWAAARGIRVFWIEHDRVGRWLTCNPWLPKLRRLALLATTVTVSALSRKIYIDLGWPAERIVAIPNGVERHPSINNQKPQRYEASGARPETANLPLRMGCVARLTQDKGVDVLIAAMANLSEVALTIVGRGRDEALVRSAIAASPAKDRITLIPRVDDLDAFFQKIDVFVLPSREHDPFGMVAAEAMIRGIPVIVTDACGIASYLESGTDAIVIHAGDQQALRDAVKPLLDAATRERIGACGRRTALRSFSAESMLQCYEHLLR